MLPGFAHELDLAEYGILPRRVEEAPTRIETMRLPPENGAEIEAEAAGTAGMTS